MLWQGSGLAASQFQFIEKGRKCDRRSVRAASELLPESIVSMADEQAGTLSRPFHGSNYNG